MLPEGIGNAIHLLAAVLWIGGLAVLVLGIRPALRQALSDSTERDRVVGIFHRRFLLLGAVSAAVLFASGFMMMATDEHFEGFGSYQGTWSRLLVLKHVLFFGMVIVLGLMRRVHVGKRGPKAESDLVDVSLMLGIAVLVVTGLLTAVK